MRITRQIGIDMGHRVFDHGSKCKNLHGHRYTIEATLRGPLVAAGEETGMVMDFGFLKEVMMDQIDTPCDHAMCLWIRDPQLAHALGPDLERIWEGVALDGYWSGTWAWGKLYAVWFTPTAEQLAAHWFHRMCPQINHRTGGRAVLDSVRVWETPNCWVDYHGNAALINDVPRWNFAHAPTAGVR